MCFSMYYNIENFVILKLTSLKLINFYFTHKLYIIHQVCTLATSSGAPENDNFVSQTYVECDKINFWFIESSLQQRFQVFVMIKMNNALPRMNWLNLHCMVLLPSEGSALEFVGDGVNLSRHFQRVNDWEVFMGIIW